MRWRRHPVGAFVHLKVDTGPRPQRGDRERLAAVLRSGRCTRSRRTRCRAWLWSHLANAGTTTTRLSSRRSIARSTRLALRALTPLSCTSPRPRRPCGLPEARFSLVRIGIGAYGLAASDDMDAAALGLTPAMQLSAAIATVKRVPAGTGVSYGYDYRTDRETHARARAARLRRRDAAPRLGPRPRLDQRRHVSRRGPHRDGPVRRRRRRCPGRPGDRAISSATRLRACPRPTTGRMPPARSTTRSSRASVHECSAGTCRDCSRPPKRWRRSAPRLAPRAARGRPGGAQRRARRGQDHAHARHRRGARRARRGDEPDLRACAHAPA